MYGFDRLREDELFDGFINDPAGSNKNEESFDGCREVFEFSMPEGMLIVGRLTRCLNGKKGNEGSNEVNA